MWCIAGVMDTNLPACLLARGNQRSPFWPADYMNAIVIGSRLCGCLLFEDKSQCARLASLHSMLLVSRCSTYCPVCCQGLLRAPISLPAGSTDTSYHQAIHALFVSSAALLHR